MDAELFTIGLEARQTACSARSTWRAPCRRPTASTSSSSRSSPSTAGWCLGRSVLTDRQRSLNNLCILAALNRPEEFKTHFRAALGNGCTLDELRDTLIQIAVYAGVPAGVEAFRLAAPGAGR